MFSKIYEGFLHKNLTNYVNPFLLKFISADRKSYSTTHVLIRLTENWIKPLYEKEFVGAVLMDLSKAFDSIPHDHLLIAKMFACGFSINAVTFSYSYLKRQKRNVKINITFIWSSPRLNSWSTFFQYVYKWFICLDYKNRPVKFCWRQYYNRSWKNYRIPYFYTWNSIKSLLNAWN